MTTGTGTTEAGTTSTGWRWHAINPGEGQQSSLIPSYHSLNGSTTSNLPQYPIPIPTFNPQTAPPIIIPILDLSNPMVLQQNQENLAKLAKKIIKICSKCFDNNTLIELQKIDPYTALKMLIGDQKTHFTILKEYHRQCLELNKKILHQFQEIENLTEPSLETGDNLNFFKTLHRSQKMKESFLLKYPFIMSQKNLMILTQEHKYLKSLEKENDENINFLQNTITQFFSPRSESVTENMEADQQHGSSCEETEQYISPYMLIIDESLQDNGMVTESDYPPSQPQTPSFMAISHERTRRRSNFSPFY